MQILNGLNKRIVLSLSPGVSATPQMAKMVNNSATPQMGKMVSNVVNTF